ncbi:hypothetical protein HMPREF0731_0661, partial [Pseudoroseomonas cervicalis ATCC 49957]
LVRVLAQRLAITALARGLARLALARRGLGRVLALGEGRGGAQQRQRGQQRKRMARGHAMCPSVMGGFSPDNPAGPDRVSAAAPPRPRVGFARPPRYMRLFWRGWTE